MRVMLDTNRVVESRPELRGEMDEALMQLAETMGRLHLESFAHKAMRENCPEQLNALHALWQTLDTSTQQMRCLGIAVIRALELIRDRDPEQFEAIAKNTIKLFAHFMEEKHGDPVVEELTPEEVASWPTPKGWERN